ncbi:hypothetical protein Slin15195_G100670 [Septoria linicola]|uniref:Uncharacterized protein n=1 Tax=Septoria linicola TaxID=215465 RepID=A0A9Q9EPP8_9PEZI|nr:hypothetical protein Slin15195_G100670 [Septoria linicola]
MINYHNRRCFSQFVRTQIPSMEIPAKTTMTTLYCKHAGKWGLVAALACVLEECDVCAPYLQEINTEDDVFAGAEDDVEDDVAEEDLKEDIPMLSAENDSGYEEEVERPQKRRRLV